MILPRESMLLTYTHTQSFGFWYITQKIFKVNSRREGHGLEDRGWGTSVYASMVALAMSTLPPSASSLQNMSEISRRIWRHVLNLHTHTHTHTDMSIFVLRSFTISVSSKCGHWKSSSSSSSLYLRILILMLYNRANKPGRISDLQLVCFLESRCNTYVCLCRCFSSFFAAL
jgi:hypothetical protein